jgi:SNF2 family DNA or RNA helicase
MASFNGSYLPHQMEAIQWLVEKESSSPRGAILADEPGMGKTIVTIGLMLERPVEKTLIIAPKSVVPQWVSEIERFSDLSVEVVDGNDPWFDYPPDVCVTTYAFLQRMSGSESWLYGMHWDRIVCDEAHVMRNPNSKTFKNATRLRADSRIALTGTPIQNKAADMKSLSRWIGYPDVESGLRSICKNLVLRRVVEDSFSMPELDIRVHPVDFSEEERFVYEQVENFASERVASAFSHMEVLEMLMRCRQICIHPQLFIDGVRKKLSVEREGLEALLSENWTGSSSKIDALCDLVSQHSDKAIVFCSFVGEMEMIAQALGSRGVMNLSFHGGLDSDTREDVLSRFREDGAVQVLLVQIAAGGAGLNLQVANRVYVMSPHYNPTMEVQALGRCYRHGQCKPVQVIRLVMRDSIEERICEIQDKKLTLISETLSDPRIFQRMAPSSMMTTSRARFIFKKRLAV